MDYKYDGALTNPVIGSRPPQQEEMPSPEITMELAELGDDTQRLYETLQKLEGRIEPTLCNPVPQATSESAPKREYKTQLARQLATVHDGVRASLDRAHDILRRCEL